MAPIPTNVTIEQLLDIVKKLDEKIDALTAEVAKLQTSPVQKGFTEFGWAITTATALGLVVGGAGTVLYNSQRGKALFSKEGVASTGTAPSEQAGKDLKDAIGALNETRVSYQKLIELMEKIGAKESAENMKKFQKKENLEPDAIQSA